MKYDDADRIFRFNIWCHSSSVAPAHVIKRKTALRTCPLLTMTGGRAQRKRQWVLQGMADLTKISLRRFLGRWYTSLGWASPEIDESKLECTNKTHRTDCDIYIYVCVCQEQWCNRSWPHKMFLDYDFPGNFKGFLQLGESWLKLR